MANNLKKFNTVADYQAATLNYPAVSLIAANYGVFFDKTAPTPTFGGLTVKYNIIDPTVEVQLFNGGGSSESSSESGSGGGGGALPTTMIVDGNSETPINTWRFQTAGEHIVQYEFADNQIPENFMNGGGDKFPHLVGVEIGDAITSIGNSAFEANSHLTSATIGSGVTSIGNNAFNGCSSLTSITVEAEYPPTLSNANAFDNTNNCPIYVPASVVDMYKISTSTGWNEYASRIQAIQ